MKKRMFKTGMLGTVIATIVLAVLTIAAVLLIYIIVDSALGHTNLVEADRYDDFGYLDAKYMSDSFASDEDGNKFVFVQTPEQKDGKVYYFIVGLPESVYNSQEIQHKIHETQKEDGDETPLRFKGTLEQTSAELDTAAQESFSQMLDIKKDEAESYLGHACVFYSKADTNLANMDKGMWAALIFLVVAIGLWVAEMVRGISRQIKKNKKIANAKTLYETNSDYQNGVRQAEEPNAQHFKAARVYITRDYVVSYQEGLEVFRIDQIRELYGYDQRRSSALMGFFFGVFASSRMDHYLVALTSDGEVHQFARLGMALKLHNQMVTLLMQKNQEMRLGRMNTPVSEVLQSQPMEKLNLAKVKGFYGSDDIWSGRSLNNFKVE